MQTKRDLLQAHRLMTFRAGQALILGEPDYPEQPLKRLSVGTFASVMVAVLVAAGFGIAGMLMGGGTKGLKEGNLLLIDKQTGSRFIWCKPEGSQEQVLCPVANYASAKLAVGSNGKQKSVSGKSLSKFKRGPMIGIAGAPDTVPDRKLLADGAWSVCVQQASVNGVYRPVASLIADRGIKGRRLDSGSGVLVRTETGGNYLIWNNQRMRVSDAGMTLLQQGSAAPGTVSDAFVNALPDGPEFAPPAIPGFGGKASTTGGLNGTVGQVYLVKSSGVGSDQYYVLLQNGLSAITPLQAALIQAKSDYRLQRNLPIETSQVTANSSQGQTVPAGKLPPTMIRTQAYTPSEALCVVYPKPAEGQEQQAVLTIGGAEDLPKPTQVSNTGVNVVIPPGKAVLAGVLQAGGSVQSINTYVFVSDSGRRYPLKSPEVAQALGYTIAADGGDSVPVPANLLNLIPSGPVLDPDKAALPIPAGSSGL